MDIATYQISFTFGLNVKARGLGHLTQMEKDCLIGLGSLDVIGDAVDQVYVFQTEVAAESATRARTVAEEWLRGAVMGARLLATEGEKLAV